MLDRTERGELSGGRRDVITYICQGPGTFAIPAVRFIWFDLGTKQLITNDLPAHTLQVVANPALATADGASPAGGTSVRSRMWWGIVGLIAVFVPFFLAARSARFRRVIAGLFLPFQALHLQPLNPTEQFQQK